jgi:ABC-type molybdate transport system substrate-binding protein
MTRLHRRRLALLTLWTAALSMTVPPAAADSMDALYEKAKAEKALVFYAGGPTAPYQKLVAAFETAYPGIKVTFSGGFSNVLNEKIEQQMKAAGSRSTWPCSRRRRISSRGRSGACC